MTDFRKREADKHYIDDLGRRITKRMYGVPDGFDQFYVLERELAHLRNGGCLKYEHLERIQGPFWNFRTWWRWPPKGEIEDLLQQKTNGLFKILDKLDPEQDHNQRSEEEPLIRLLHYDIFKNLELVSIVLRFVDARHFGIYSHPVARYLNTPRGDSYVPEYRNYLYELRKIRDVYALDKVSLADEFCWVLAMVRRQGLEDLREEIVNWFHRDIQERTRKKAAREILESQLLGKTDMEKAEFYFECGEYDTAAKWAGGALESAVEKRAVKHGISLEVIEQNGVKRPKHLAELMDELCVYCNLDSLQLKKVRQLRNLAVHSPHRFSREEIERMLIIIRDIADRSISPETFACK